MKMTHAAAFPHAFLKILHTGIFIFQLSILERHCHHFDPEETGEEENKLVWTNTREI